MKQLGLWTGIALVAATGFAGRAAAQAPAETAESFPWTVSAGPGYLLFDRNQWNKDSAYLQGRLSYEFNRRLDLDTFLFLVPSIDANVPDNRTEVPDWSTAWMVGGGMEGLLHLTSRQAFDPFLAAGVQASYISENQKNDRQADVALRIGGGAFYHISKEWALRGDARVALGGIGADSEANLFLEAGLCWTWGAPIPVNYMVAGGAKDSDADGLTDAEETGIYNTNPHDADTDHDGLTDYEEVRETYHFKTDPLDPDTDMDMLKDGAEVTVLGTDPTDPDTDNGGVTDGHEVIEDGTDPLFKADDLILFSLNLQFDKDKSIIKPIYFDKLEIIGAKTMTREHPGSTAKLEGHADKLKGSKAAYNQALSERRAKAVMDHLSSKFNIAPARMTAVGYGFSKPKYPNDPIYGNELNRRVDVYVRPLDHPVSPREQPKFNVDDVIAPAAVE